MPLTHHATPKSAPRPGTQAERIVQAFDSGLDTTRKIANACQCKRVQVVHNVLERWRPGWKRKMANWVEPEPAQL